MELKNIDKAVNLQNEIKNIEQFLFVIDPEKQVRRGSGMLDISMLFRKKIDTSFSILGSRWFGFGTHQHLISVPDYMLTDIHRLFVEKLQALKQELDEL